MQQGEVTAADSLVLRVELDMPVLEFTSEHVSLTGKVRSDQEAAVTRVSDTAYAVGVMGLEGDGELVVTLSGLLDEAGYSVPATSFYMRRDTTPPPAPSIECPPFTLSATYSCTVDLHGAELQGELTDSLLLLPSLATMELEAEDPEGVYVVRIYTQGDGELTISFPEGASIDTAGNPSPASLSSSSRRRSPSSRCRRGRSGRCGRCGPWRRRRGSTPATRCAWRRGWTGCTP